MNKKRRIGFKGKKRTPATHPPPHAGQRHILELPGRFKIAVCGRRFGKSATGGIAAVDMCENREGARVMWIMPTADQNRTPMQELSGWLSKNEAWEWLKSAATFHHKKTGSTIEFRSAEQGDALRGPGLDLAIFDEAADIQPNVWFEIILPMLTERDGRALILGTPRGKSNWLFGLFASKQHARGWSTANLPTNQNPAITPAQIESIRAEMTEEKFRQEFLAEFVDAGTAVFPDADSHVFGDAMPKGRTFEVKDAKGLVSVHPVHYALGVDLARVHDFTVCAALDMKTGRVEGIERFNRLPWESLIARVLNFCSRFSGEGLIDATGVGGPIEEALRNQGAPLTGFIFTESSRAELIEWLSVTWEKSKISIPADPAVINEFRAFEWQTERSAHGMTKVVAKSTGATDDCVMAIALAHRIARLKAPDLYAGNPWKNVGLFA